MSSYLFIFLNSTHFFVDKITSKWLNQMPWNLAHICIGIWPKHSKFFNLDLDSWPHLGAILWNFLKINSWSYLHNQNVFLIHIYYDQGQYQSGQFHVKKRARARTSARQCARKIFKCSKSSQIFFAYVSGHFKHFIKKSRTRACARVFARNTNTNHRIALFVCFMIYLIFFRTIWYHVYLFMTINNKMSVNSR